MTKNILYFVEKNEIGDFQNVQGYASNTDLVLTDNIIF